MSNACHPEDASCTLSLRLDVIALTSRSRLESLQIATQTNLNTEVRLGRRIEVQCTSLQNPQTAVVDRT